MTAVQLNFSLRTSAKCKTVHLVGSWDNYQGQLPLSGDSAKVGGWKGTFRFQNSTLELGRRYWYYYVIDGYHCSHDPARESVFEPVSGRTLNILDIPNGAPRPTSYAASTSGRSSKSMSSSRHSSHRPGDLNVATGRSLSPSQIRSPKPSKPYETRQIATEKFDPYDMDRLAQQYNRHSIATSSGSRTSFEGDSDSDLSSRGSSSDMPSLSSRSSNSSSPSSISSNGSYCTCERYAITRSGARVKLDCRGQRCGYSSSSSSSGCSSESEGEQQYTRQATRRQGVLVRDY